MIESRAVEGLIPVETTDEGATLESLYRTHAKRIYSLAYRFAGNAADAEELLQDIFLLAHRKLDSFRHEAALSTWLHRLAVNRCLDHVRSRAARQDAATEPLNAEAPPPTRADFPARSGQSDPRSRRAVDPVGHEPQRHALEGTVGGGGARLELSTFSGDMTIVVGGAP